MGDFGETFRVAGHSVRKAEPPEEYQYDDGADIIGYECVDCPFWGQAVAEFRKAPCARDADHRGEAEDPAHLIEAVDSLLTAFLMRAGANAHRDPALARADEAAAHIEDYRRGPLQPKTTGNMDGETDG